jgi:hypothetical protein
MRRLFALIPSVLLVCACSSSSETGTEPAADGGAAQVQISAACAADNRKDIYTQGLTKTASDLSVIMTDSEFTPTGSSPIPGRVQKGMNTLTVQIEDGSKTPVDGATVTLALIMPDHGHGSALTPKVADMGGGKYQVTNVWLSMAGLWRFTFNIVQNGQTKTTDFQFCVDG